ncbi:MAG TPA: helix-turn-helix transcriptional regulator [Verrucomicrobiae bacterium]|nr:helix-turn-helix transcriptional regulator [Verrucomicrobiae bacterium]
MRRDRAEVAIAFGNALRAARLDAGLSQEELAHRANVDRTFVSRAERGERQPALATVLLIARALGLQPGRLVNTTETLIAEARTTYRVRRKS